MGAQCEFGDWLIGSGVSGHRSERRHATCAARSASGSTITSAPAPPPIGAHKYAEIDVYNESYHTGPDPSLAEMLKHNYWNVYQAGGIADIYREVRDTMAASGATAKVFVNEYGTYRRHRLCPVVHESHRADSPGGHCGRLRGCGRRHRNSTLPGRLAKPWQYHADNSKSFGSRTATVAHGIRRFERRQPGNGGDDSGRHFEVAFGTADATGFFMWGFHQESGTGATTLFASVGRPVHGQHEQLQRLDAHAGRSEMAGSARNSGLGRQPQQRLDDAAQRQSSAPTARSTSTASGATTS